jgi:S-DNA-T family DNA segregation ATPase FtsK/SpoIIIE
VSNPALPAFSQIPSQLLHLRELLNHFAKTEDQIQRDLKQRRSVVEYRASLALEQLSQNSASRAAKAESERVENESRIQARAQSRKERITRAHTNALRSVPKRAQIAREKWLGETQHQRFLSERLYTNSLRETDAKFLETTRFLTTARDHYAQIQSTARKTLSGCPALANLLQRSLQEIQPDAAQMERWRLELETQITAALAALQSLQNQTALRFFSKLPLPTLLPFAALLSLAGLIPFGPTSVGWILSGSGFAAIALLLFLIRGFVASRARPLAATLADALHAAGTAHHASCACTDAWHTRERDRIQSEFDERTKNLERRWNQADSAESEHANQLTKKLNQQLPRALQHNAQMAQAACDHAAALQQQPLLQAETADHNRKTQILAQLESDRSTLEQEETSYWQTLSDQWTASVPAAWNALQNSANQLPPSPPPWTSESVAAWVPSSTFPNSVPVGNFEIQLAGPELPVPQSPRFSLPGATEFQLPLALELPGAGNLLLESTDPGSPQVAAVFNQVLLQLLSSLPPGKFSCTIFDPIGLGQNFAGLMHLGDYEESLINRRIWTQRDQIDARLAELSAHIEKVIQMYLRDEYPTISDYNTRAGVVSEKYHFLLLADFPTECSESSAKRLQSILASGARCGVFTLLHWNPRTPLPQETPLDDLRRHCLSLRLENGSWSMPHSPLPPGSQIRLLQPPPPGLASDLIHKIGRANVDSTRVQVPFAQIAPQPHALWSGSTTHELRVPIGRTGATKQQFFSLGHGTKQHALLAGKTGSGKSTLLHVLITNLALHFSPNEVEFFLIDFKKGVEFKCYADHRLPHARVIAVESDRQFALSVLERIDEELRRRGEIFRSLGVQDLAGYRNSNAHTPLPRSLLLIDEFQEFFVEDDSIAQKAALLLDRIVRQGRAFGIHALLGSQTLGGAYTLARTTLGQMGVRIALQCNEADAYLIMDEENPAPRLLSRPGEGIYNDAAGALEGNSPFQVVWLPDTERDTLLRKISALAAQKPSPVPPPVVFEGNAPAHLPENPLLHALLQNPTIPAQGAAPKAWIGAPNAIKGPTEIQFLRQNGQNLLLVGQRQESVLGIFTSCILSIAAQIPPQKAEFYIVHTATSDTQESKLFELLASALPHPTRAPGPLETISILEKISEELHARIADPQNTGPQIFVVLHDLHRNRKLRYDEDAAFSFSSDGPRNPGLILDEILAQGSSVGIHLLANLDSLNSVQRFFSRKSLSEFEMRVLFQMSPNDSSSLIDSPMAASLGLHRAILAYEQLGILETFRPYNVPHLDWIQSAIQNLCNR